MSASSLAFVQLQIVYYGITTALALGNLGAFAIILIFWKNRRNPGAMYLIAGAVMNIMTLSLSTAQYLYSVLYGDPTGRSLVYCKLYYYLTSVWGQMSRYFFVFACIDRFAITSVNVRIRAVSRPSVALWSLGTGAVVLHIIPIHILILISIANGRCNAYGSYYIIYSIYKLVFSWLIPCTTMISFGYMAYSNVKKLRTRIRPIQNDPQTNMTISRHDRDLFIMVFTEAIAYVILMMLYPCILTEISITSYLGIEKSLQRQEIENFILFLSQFLLTISNAMPFYIYFVASKAFRDDCKKFIGIGWRWIMHRTALATEIPGQTNTQ